MLKSSSTVSSNGLGSTVPRSGAPSSVSGGEPRAAVEADQDVQSTLTRRALSPHTVVSFAVAIGILWFVVRRLDVDPAAIWEQLRRADPLPLSVAFGLWYGAFFVRGWRWGRMLESAGVADAPGSGIPATPRLAGMILLSYFANSLVPAKLGDAYRAYLLKREAAVPWSAGFGSILAERLADAMMLVVVLGSAVLVVFGRSLPAQATPAITLGGVLLLAGIVILAAMWLTRGMLARVLPARLREAYTRLNGAVFGSLRRPFLVFGIGLLLWLGDGTRVWFVARALNASLPWSVTVLVATMGALLTIIPFTPAGLGVVELGVGSVLVGVLGLDPVTAGSIILLDRVVAYWSLLLVGGALFAWRARRDLGGSRGLAVDARSS